MRRLLGLTRTNITAAAVTNTSVTYPNSVFNGIALKKPAAQPASLLPNAFERNHTPIISPTIRSGASLVTALRPTGLTHSSPSSEMKYDTISHHGLTLMPALLAIAPAGMSTANDSPIIRRPHANFAGTDGSCRPSRSHIQPKTGARRMTKIGCTD